MEKQIKSPSEHSRSVPKLRFLEFEGEWEMKKLGIIGEYIGGGTPDTSVQEYWEGNIPWISSSDIIENDIHNINIQKYITDDAIKNSATKKIPANSLIIVSRVGVGKFAINKSEVCTSQDFTNIVIDAKVFDANFSAYNLYKNIDILYNISQGTSIKGFTVVDLKKTELSFPTVPEQTKIANFLTAVDEKIQALKKKKSLLENYKKGIMQKLFSQELRFKDDTSTSLSAGNGEEFPEWEMKKLGEIGTFYSGGTPLTTKREYFDGTIPFIRSGEINADKTEQFISELGLKNSSSKMVEIGDILYALYGATSGEVGISKINGAINQAVLCIKSSQNHYYLFSLLKFEKENIIKTYLQGGQGNLSADIVKKIEIPLPSFPEQTLIANFLSAIDEKINYTETKKKQSEMWKKGLLQKMFI